jgi:pimeloyl-ACP methyl ester carboxylesterase
LVLLAPAYSRELPAQAPTAADSGAAMTAQSRATFDANWQRQVGCDDQYDPGVAATVWTEMLASDPVGAAWGVGLRRAPRTSVWGWNQAAVGRMRTPTLMVAGAHDAQVAPARVRELYEDLGAEQKVMLDLGCASHNAMWERVHLDMFSASLEWLQSGTVDGLARGIVRRGYR